MPLRVKALFAVGATFVALFLGLYLMTRPLVLAGFREYEDQEARRTVQRVLAALRTKLGDGIPGSIGPGLALMDVLSTHLATDLSAIDLALLSGHLSADRRIELTEGVILEATTTDDGRYVLVVIGRAHGADFGPLHAYLAAELAKPMPTPVPSGSPAPSGGP